ncbi:MAG: SOS response-associated peptidase [Clostridia bacterium]|nr:SOS response-associated peptidase [Clostridia bacterium]
MCGRFYIAEEDTAEDLLRIIDALNRRYKGITPVKTQGEIRPTDIIPVMANSPSMSTGVYAMKWGYTMPDGKPMFNARSETAATKPLFSDGMRQRRCIIPATLYFEWQKAGTQKIKHAIATAGSDMIYMAGIYRIEGNRAACSILTRPPADCISHIHNRMPVILPAEATHDWLNLRFDPNEVLAAALTNMTYYPCS